MRGMDGQNISFWGDYWLGHEKLTIKYSRLFYVSAQHNCKISDMGEWSNDRWSLNLLWRRPLLVWEKELVDNLLSELNSVKPNFRERDK